MKCTNCGAEISSESKNCPYCGGEIIREKPVTNITNNYYAQQSESNTSNTTCPRCGSSNVKFRREEVGNVRNKSSKKVYYRTVGICQGCGNTWNANAAEKKGHGIGWWILVFLFWPIALSIWFYKTDKIKLDKKIKIGIIAAVWVVLILISALTGGTESEEGTTVDTNDPSGYSQISENTEEAQNSSDSSSGNSNSSGEITILVGETIGEYGKEIVLNKNTDLPTTKYLYKIPEGTYNVTTTEEKYASFFIVKDEIGIEESNADYPEILQYVSDGYILTNGNDDLNGTAQKSVTISIAEDESIQIVGAVTLVFERTN